MFFHEKRNNSGRSKNHLTHLIHSSCFSIVQRNLRPCCSKIIFKRPKFRILMKSIFFSRIYPHMCLISFPLSVEKSHTHSASISGRSRERWKTISAIFPIGQIVKEKVQKGAMHQTVFGCFKEVAVPAALSSRTEAGGVFRTKVKLLSCPQRRSSTGLN